MVCRLGRARRNGQDIFIKLLIIAIAAFVIYMSTVQFNQRLSGSGNSAWTSFKLQVSNDSCHSNAQNHAVTDFNTFDIYRDRIAHGLGPSKSASPRPYNNAKLKVFVVPFTHVDPGWLKTFDSYSEDTDSILNNMHRFMKKNEKMKFIWAEMVFLERWWSKQNSSVRDDVRGLLKSGRLELVSGSWVMTDEANVYYPVTVDNIIEGHQFIHHEIYNVSPSVVWSNDPFGYSNTIPYLFTQAGISRSVINRINHNIKIYLQKMRAIPFRWLQYFDSSGKAEMLTHILPYSHYDILNSCGPNPSVCCQFDFKRLTHWSCPASMPEPITSLNVAAKAQSLLWQLKAMSQMYESNVILMMLGDDFRFNMIDEWHQQYDNFLPLFDEINKGHDAEISFGTLTDYFNALERWYHDQKLQPPSLSGDFFPYKCSLGDVWVGYFSTRPFYKRQGRFTHNFIRASDIISAQAWSTMEVNERAEVEMKLKKARRALSLFQHHDAITGTSRRHVMKDYSITLHEATELARSVFESAASALARSQVIVLEYPMTHKNPETLIPVNIVELGSMTINVYNSLPYDMDELVTIRVDTVDVSITDGDEELIAQIEPYIHLGEIDRNTFLLVFRCTLRALSVSTFFLKYDIHRKLTKITTILTTEKLQKLHSFGFPRIFNIETIDQEGFYLENQYLKTVHNSKNGMLTRVLSKETGKTTLKTDFYKYKHADGGAYVMRIQSHAKLHHSGQVKRFLTKGPLQQTAYLFLSNVYKKITVKNVKSSFAQQINFFIRLDITNERNTEFAMRITTDLKNPRFYVDSAGLQLLRRQHHKTLPIPENFYPMPSACVLEDNDKRITLATNVEHGVSPLHQGVEIILDRILNQDDGKGLGSGPDSLPTDLLPTEMRFSVLVEAIDQPLSEKYSTYHTPAGHLSIQGLLYPPIVTISTDAIPPLRFRSVLPCNYQLLTVRPVANGKRLMIIFNNGITCRTNTKTTCSGDLQTGLTDYLRSLSVIRVQETNIVGLKPVTEEIPLEQYKATIEPYKFLSLLLTYSS